MKKNIFSILLLLGFFAAVPLKTKAQTIELLAGNTLNGVIQGTLLGGATMGINNTDNLDYLRVGVGLGALYGIGMGVYDLTQSRGSGMLVSGFFNDGSNSSIIVLLDTFYGAAAGSVMATAFMLVANKPLLEGLQYGASIGAWAGFGFGLFDTFVFADRTPAGIAAAPSVSKKADGLLGLSFENGTSLGFLNPGVIQTKTAGLERKISPSVDVMNLRINF